MATAGWARCWVPPPSSISSPAGNQWESRTWCARASGRLVISVIFIAAGTDVGAQRCQLPLLPSGVGWEREIKGGSGGQPHPCGCSGCWWGKAGWPWGGREQQPARGLHNSCLELQEPRGGGGRLRSPPTTRQLPSFFGPCPLLSHTPSGPGGLGTRPGAPLPSSPGTAEGTGVLPSSWVTMSRGRGIQKKKKRTHPKKVQPQTPPAPGRTCAGGCGSLSAEQGAKQRAAQRPGARWGHGPAR